MCGKSLRLGRGGFNLIELLVGVAVSSVIMTVLISFTVYAAKSMAAMTNYVDLEQKSQNALDTMTSEIRATKFLVNYNTKQLNGVTITNALTFKDWDDQDLTFNFTENVLLRQKGGQSTILLTNVDYLSFQVFKRNPVPNTYEQYPTSDATNCKLVSVSWICSRSILGSRVNTESVQTAKIVIRKQ
jgi:prepilin-type N-terminal cleavage/methylation domain-containing protein